MKSASFEEPPDPPNELPEAPVKEPAQAPQDTPPINSPAFLSTATDKQIQDRLINEIAKIITKHFPVGCPYCLLSLYDTKTSIDSWDADRIFKALQEENPDKKRDVLLFLVSNGGRIEPAYQITKICKQFSHSTFHVTVPRRAKSAATLIAIGADFIHMGLMGELGPIDPQLDGLPALGVKRSLEIIASICAKYPKSSDAFSKYLGSKLTIEQIGYCDRVSESAVQYAERLLQKNPAIAPDDVGRIAYELVHEYKDHGFVIDVEEAQNHLGSAWIKSDSPEIKFAEEIYQLFNSLNFMLDVLKKRLIVVGSLTKGPLVWEATP